MSEEHIRDAARKLAGRRRHKTRLCAVCGRVFEGMGRGAYCSPTCKKRAYRQRRSGKRLGTVVGATAGSGSRGAGAVEPSAAGERSVVSPLVARLDALRAKTRPLEGVTSADLVREAREERAARW